MKTTKLIPVFFLLLMSSNYLKAQKTYATLGVGYGFSIASQQLGTNETDFGGVSVQENVKGSLGKGISLGASFGFHFSDHGAFELGFYQLLGNKYEFTYKDDDGNASINIKARMMRVIPSIKLISAQDKKLKPYGRIGIVIGFGGVVTSEYESRFGSETEYSKDEDYGGFSFGLASAFGGRLELSESLSLFSEFVMINQNWSPNKGKKTEFTENGVDKLNGLTTYERETEYLDKVTYSGSPNTSQPYQQLRYYVPLSSFGLTFGIHFNF